jgi:DNA-binding beta-propeller fold protein YncE
VLAGIERTVDIIGITEFVIALASTSISRGAIFFLVTIVLLIFWLFVTWRFHPLFAYSLLVSVAFILLVFSFDTLGTSKIRVLPAVLVLATNLIPDQITGWFIRNERTWFRFMIVGVGVAEVFFFRHYVEWLNILVNGETKPRFAFAKVLGMFSGFVLTSGMVTVALDYEPLVPLEQMLRMSPRVSLIDSGDFNWIELDASKQYLYASGHGLRYLQRYDLTQPSVSPRLSDTPIDGAQSFAYDPDANELYVYNAKTRYLLYIDATTLKLERELPLTDVSPGDSWIAVDSQTNTLLIISESDLETGTPFLVLDRSTGTVLDRRNWGAGNFLMHPTKSIVYLSFFRRIPSLIAYDLKECEVASQVPTNSRVDRLAFLNDSNELLLTLPTESKIAYYDADTLALKRYLDSTFGVRVLAVDSVKKLLFWGSLATGTIDIFDLTTHQRWAGFYLAPWLRTITIDPERSVAYVSAKGALYKLDYGNSH